MSVALEERSREVAALAAEVERLRMALGCIRIVADSSALSADQIAEIRPICELALGPDTKGSS